MSDMVTQIKTLLQELLSYDYKKTALLLAEELRVEHPALYNEIMVYYSNEYGLGGCGIQMSPLTIVNQALSELFEDGLVQKSPSNGIVLWEKK